MTADAAVDVARYLARIGLPDPGDPSVASLERLQRAHLTAVPFENLDVYAGRGVATELDWSYPKVVDRNRGGWCFELNGTFAALLAALGYRVTRLGAAVLLEGDTDREGHLTVRVDLDRPYLVDVGFGDSFFRPLPLDAPGPHDGGKALYRFHSIDGRTTLIELGPEGPHAQYRFTDRPRALSDFSSESTRLQTDPSLHWRAGRFATRLLGGGPDRVTLLEDRLKLRHAGVWTEQAVAPGEWAATLDRWFALEP